MFSLASTAQRNYKKAHSLVYCVFNAGRHVFILSYQNRSGNENMAIFKVGGLLLIFGSKIDFAKQNQKAIMEAPRLSAGKMFKK